MVNNYGARFTYHPVSNSDKDARVYRCWSVTNNFEFIPGFYYTRAEVEKFCLLPSWKILIVEAKLDYLDYRD